MKKYLSLLVIAGLLFAVAPSFAKAEGEPTDSSGSGSTLENRQAKIRAEIEKREAAIAETKAQAQEKLGEFATRASEKKTKILPSKPPKNRFPKEAGFDILTII